MDANENFESIAASMSLCGFRLKLRLHGASQQQVETIEPYVMRFELRDSEDTGLRHCD